MHERYAIVSGKWKNLKERAMPIREIVFVFEQQVPVELEWDGLDDMCTHFVALTPLQLAVGTARLTSQGHIGRMAVIKEYRGLGIGALLLQTIIDSARLFCLKKLELNAQTHALPFYEKFGFVANGDEFDDAGIPHRHMTLTLIDEETTYDLSAWNG